MGRRRAALAGLAALGALALGAPAAAAGAAAVEEAGLGGGSTVPAGALVAVPAGTNLPARFAIHADNPEDRPIEVRFVADVPAGVRALADVERFRLEPGERGDVIFGFAVGREVVPGDHTVSVRLERADLDGRDGIVHVPAIGARLTLRVVGTSARVTVTARSAATRAPVDGTLVLRVAAEGTAGLEIARAEGSVLDADVAPGEYEAVARLGDRTLASEHLSVSGGDHRTVTLDVETIAFALVAARPVEDRGRVVLAELTVDVLNHLDPVERPSALHVRVSRSGTHVEDLVLEEPGALPTGISHVTHQYRPDGGFAPGTYRFDVSLVLPDATLRAPEPATLVVTEPAGVAWWPLWVGGVAIVALWLVRTRVARRPVLGRSVLGDVRRGRRRRDPRRAPPCG